MRFRVFAGLMLVGATLAQPAAGQVPKGTRQATPPTAALLPQNTLLIAASAGPDVVSKDAKPLGLPLPKYGRWVGITKWATLAASIGFGALGFSLHNEGDKSFNRLSDLCEADPANCRARNPDGSYEDAVLESLYQDVVSKDRQARFSLIAAELNFGVSVLLFIVDFQKRSRPQDIPYDPDDNKAAFRLTAEPGELALRYYFD